MTALPAKHRGIVLHNTLSAADRTEPLGERIALLAAQIQVCLHQLLTLIREFDEQEAWAAQGAASCAGWLSWKIGLGEVAAREKVRVARALGELPQIDAAFARAEISYSKVRAITRVATAENEATLLHYARQGTTAHVEQIVRKYRAARRADQPWVDSLAHDQRYLRSYTDDYGMLVIRARLPAEQAAAVLKALQLAEQALRDDERARAEASAAEDVSAESHDKDAAPQAAEDVSAESPRSPDADVSAESPRSPDADVSAESRRREQEAATPTPAQRSADALVLLCQSAVDHKLRQGTAADRTQVVLRLDAEPIYKDKAPKDKAPKDKAPELKFTCCRLEHGGPIAGSRVPTERSGTSAISAETSRRLSCDTSLVTITEDEHGHAQAQPKTRTIPPAVRRALSARDRACCFPGCNRRRYLEAHHIQHWSRGGPHTLENLVHLCSYHHHLVHEGGFSLGRTSSGQIIARAPSGEPISEVPAPPTGRLKLPEVGTPRMPVWRGDPCDYSWAIEGLLEEGQ